MWNVVEHLNDGLSSEFGPFASYKEALQFLVDTELHDTDNNLTRVMIIKDKI